MTPAPLTALALGAALALTGCQTRERLLSTTQAPYQPAAATGQATLLGQLARSGQAGVLFADITTGGITTWRGGDNATVSLDRGVLVATRMLGADLMAGEAEPTLAALRRPGGAAYVVRKRQLSGDNRDLFLELRCQMAEGGPDLGLRLMVESCQLADGRRHQNRYWLDGAGKIVRSEQWVGPEVGMLSLQPVAG